SRVHYTVRFLALGAAILGLNMFMARNDRLRVDVTSEQLSSLSSQTRQILKTLDTKYPVLIDAYVSPSVPESYTQTRLNLISTLREFEATSNGKIQVTIHETEPLTEEAQRAETKYGIKPQTVMTTQRGARRPEDIFLGVAFNCGVENV